MSDADRANEESELKVKENIESDAKLRAEHNDLKKRRRKEKLAETFRDLQRVIPRRYFRGLTRVSFETVLRIIVDYAFEMIEEKEAREERLLISDRKRNLIRELRDEIRDKVARGEKEEARILYQQNLHLLESDDDDSSEDSSDDEENDPNAEYFEVELIDSDEEADD